MSLMMPKRGVEKLFKVKLQSFFQIKIISLQNEFLFQDLSIHPFSIFDWLVSKRGNAMEDGGWRMEDR